MIDLISRQEAINAVKNIMPTKEGFYEPSDVLCELMGVPVVQPEQKTGRWIKEDRGHVEYTGICSKCGFDWIWHDAREYFNFCPN